MNTEGERWRARPYLATSLRLAILAVPLLVAWVATRFTIDTLGSRLEREPAWLLLVAAVSVVTCLGVQRLARRFLPLATLLKLTMLFPDQAPSRFTVARGSTSARLAAARTKSARTGQPSDAAEAMLSLLAALSAHDRKTRGHSERVRVFTDLLADELGLAPRDRDLLRWAALIHDIGKLRVATEILNKPGRLNGYEWAVVKAHPVDGEAIAAPLLPWLGEWGTAVRQHHERYDGRGYPDGRSGADISRAGRLVSICDAYEVMTASRAYKKPMATRSARAELIRNAGAQFDPAYVRAFLGISLPKLLWAMGPASLLMNLPFLRELAQLSGGAVAGPQAAAAAASAAVSISAVTGVHAPPVPVPFTSAQAVARQLGAAIGPARHTTVAPPRAAAGPSVHAPATSPTSARGPRPQGPASTAGVTPATPGAPAEGTSSAPTAAPPPGPVTTPPAGDRTAPVVRIIRAPSGTTLSRTGLVFFTVDDATAHSQYSLDGGSWTSCSSPAMVTGLGSGAHTLRVRAIDPVGNVSAVVGATWTVVDGGAVVLTTKPPAQTSDHTGAFSWTGPAGITYECMVDGGGWSPCSSPFTTPHLANGMHHFWVRAVASDGTRSAPVQYIWRVT